MKILNGKSVWLSYKMKRKISMIQQIWKKSKKSKFVLTHHYKGFIISFLFQIFFLAVQCHNGLHQNRINLHNVTCSIICIYIIYIHQVWFPSLLTEINCTFIALLKPEIYSPRHRLDETFSNVRKITDCTKNKAWWCQTQILIYDDFAISFIQRSDVHEQ